MVNRQGSNMIENDSSPMFVVSARFLYKMQNLTRLN